MYDSGLLTVMWQCVWQWEWQWCVCQIACVTVVCVTVVCVTVVCMTVVCVTAVLCVTRYQRRVTFVTVVCNIGTVVCNSGL
jgi:hypothetical protein